MSSTTSYTLTIVFFHMQGQKNICIEFIFSVTNDIVLGLLPCSYLKVSMFSKRSHGTVEIPGQN